MSLRRPSHGWLLIDKPAGPSSAQVVGRVKYLLKPAKIGHGGTLDPFATGLLPLALGEATKTMPFILDADKAYAFTLTFGFETTSDDATGEPTVRNARLPSTDEITSILPRFMGVQAQMPPAVSALKVDGQRAYALVRKGETPQLAPREVTVHRLELIGMDGDSARFFAHVSKGTYIRSLGRDIARALGSAGHISQLRRTRHGPFALEGATDMETLDKLLQSGDKPPILPVDVALHGLVAHHVSPEQATALGHGKPLVATGWPCGLVRLYAAGTLLAVAEVDSAGTASIRRGFNLAGPSRDPNESDHP